MKKLSRFIGYAIIIMSFAFSISFALGHPLLVAMPALNNPKTDAFRKRLRPSCVFLLMFPPLNILNSYFSIFRLN